MTKRVLAVGNCSFDHGNIRSMIERQFNATTDRAHSATDALTALQSTHYDLVLINRKLERDGSDGIEIIRAMKADPQTIDVPVMMITNFPDHQEQAIRAGALIGFGKARLDDPAARLVANWLPGETRESLDAELLGLAATTPVRHLAKRLPERLERLGQ